MESTVSITPVSRFIVRPLERTEIADVLKLQRKASALYLPWSAGQLESHLRNFPEGQLVVMEGEQLVGAVSTLRLNLPVDIVPLDWRRTTGNGYFHTHVRDGNTLYVADVSFAPEGERAFARRALDAALEALCQEWGLTRLLSACRLPGFAAHADALTPEAYLNSVVAERLPDPVVQGLLAQGYHPVALLPDLQNQPRSKGNLATLMEWHPHVA